MAVYKRTYHRYEGPLTPLSWRFLALSRYNFEDVRKLRFVNALFSVAMFWPLLSAIVIYANHNLSILRMLGIQSSKALNIDSAFFLTFLGFQSMLAFFLTAFIGPGLVSPDLANQALPLYLARPFSRSDYVLGKLSVLVIPLSLVTWIPGLLLFILQGTLEGEGWMMNNPRIAFGLFLGSWIWILVLSFLALALSAWVKWRPTAAGLLFGVFFVASGFGNAINGVMRTHWGNLINISYLIGRVWVYLFESDPQKSAGAIFFRAASGELIPIWACWGSLIGICLFCLYLLSLKIKGVEVVR